MLVSCGGIVNTERYAELNYRGISIYWDGLLFIRGCLANEESIRKMIDDYLQDGKIDFNALYGSFGVIVRLGSDEFVIFNDNSCMHSMYVTDTCIGSDLFAVAHYAGLQTPNLMAICEYLAYTRNFLCESFISGIYAMSNLEYYTLSKGLWKKHSKEIGDIDAPPRIDDAMAFFKDMAYSLSNLQSICALTGGYDSRTVATVMNSFHTTPCFISGDRLDSPEIVAAKRTAEMGGLNLRIIQPSKYTVTDEELRHFIENYYNYKMRMSASGFRIYEFQKILCEQGYQVLLSGDAGDMHKDFWCRQDFPFYWRKHSNSKRFLSLRVKVLDRSPYWGAKVGAAYSDLESKALKQLELLTRDRNGKSNMMYGWYFDWVPMMLSRTISTQPITYAPLQEIDLVRYSYNMLPKGKRMAFFERKLTTAANPGAANAITVYGTSGSTSFPYLVRDIFAEGLTLTRQCIRGLRRKIFRQNVMAGNVNLQQLENEIRSTELFKRALNWAQERGYIHCNLTAETVPDYLIERILNLHAVFEEFEGEVHDDRTNKSEA